MIVLPNCEVLRPDLGYLVVNRAVATGYFVLKKLFTIKHEVFHHQPRNQNVSSYFSLPQRNQRRGTGRKLAEILTRYSQAVRQIGVITASLR
jgi:hypothetical protein